MEASSIVLESLSVKDDGPIAIVRLGQSLCVRGAVDLAAEGGATSLQTDNVLLWSVVAHFSLAKRLFADIRAVRSGESLDLPKLYLPLETGDLHEFLDHWAEVQDSRK